MHDPSNTQGLECATEKGLKREALSFLSNIVIGISSTAPAYSLASALGVIAGIAAFATPGIMIVAFVPMILIATAYFHLNRSHPDCGTTFTWATRAMGPHIGWFGGWALIATNILVIPSLAVISGQYTFQLVGYTEPSTFEVAAAGVAWIAIMTAACYFGIELSARTQQVLLAVELIALLVFSAVALAKVYGAGALPGSHEVALHWFNPFALNNPDRFVEAFLAAVFVYWGWDTGVSVNEETKDPKTAPGYAAVASTLLLVAVYVLVAAAAIAFAGPDLLSKNSADIFSPIGKSVLGAGPDKLLVLAVLTSALASTQTTILPVARTTLSMAGAGALPRRFSEIHERYLSPSFATLIMGGVSIAWFIGLSMLSKNVLNDSILALGLCIAFYYGLTGLACVIFYRHELFLSFKNFALLGLFPASGAFIMLFLFVRSCLSLGKGGATTVLGLGTPLAMGAGALLLGLILMALAKRGFPEFFLRKPEVATAPAEWKLND